MLDVFFHFVALQCCGEKQTHESKANEQTASNLVGMLERQIDGKPLIQMETNCKEGISRVEINIAYQCAAALILATGVRTIMLLRILLMAACVPFYDPSLILSQSHQVYPHCGCFQT